MSGSHLICIVNLVFLTCLTSIPSTLASSSNVFEAIKSDADLSRFSELLQKDPINQVVIEKRKVTVFAPTNEAIQEWERTNPGVQLVQRNLNAHYTAALLQFKDVPITQQSFMAACQLYLRAKENPTTLSRDFSPVTTPKTNAEPEYYVNNAKIISSPLRFTIEGNQQILYKIDRVIDSYQANQIPTAWQLLTGTTETEYADVQFSERVKDLGLESLFSESGGHTFLVPISKNLPKDIDQYQIRAHVIPNQVLPVRLFQGNKDYPTAMYDSNISVTISKPEPITPPDQFNGSKSALRIEAHCAKTNTSSHHIGTTRTGFTRANIAVQNGIIHFIEAPFLVITESIWDIIEANKDGQLSQFYELINRFPEVMSVVKSSSPYLTVFAPSNAAFNEIDPARLNATLQNDTTALGVAKLHLYQGLVSTDIVSTKNYTHSNALDGRDLYYSIAQATDNIRVLTVEGGGVNATALHPDLGASNGRVHIIDKVLGIPYQSVFEKLRDDYDLSTTYIIGSRRNDMFNRNLHRSDIKFTYFAPSRSAWSRLKLTMPSEFKQLVDTNQYPVHGEHILERHLMIGPKILTIDELKKMNGQNIETARGTITISVEKDDVFLEWEGLRARILRGDVNAVNGVIHLLDNVLMKKRDLASAAPATFNPSICVLFPSLLTILVALA